MGTGVLWRPARRCHHSTSSAHRSYDNTASPVCPKDSRQ